MWGTKIDILRCDRFPTYSSTGQIVFKSTLIAPNRSQINISSRKTTETMFSRSIWSEKKGNVNLGDENRHPTDFQPTAQEVKSGLNLLSMLQIHHKYIDQVGKPPRRCFSSANSTKKIQNVDPGNENRHIVIRPISNLPLNKSNRV